MMAYNIAEERHDLDYFKNMLDEFMQQQKQAWEEVHFSQSCPTSSDTQSEETQLNRRPFEASAHFSRRD